jgi:hypothetical protein
MAVVSKHWRQFPNNGAGFQTGVKKRFNGLCHVRYINKQSLEFLNFYTKFTKKNIKI